MKIETTLKGGYLHVDRKSVKKAGLESLDILCSSSLMMNMTDAEIAKEYKKSGDYDANECKMNVFVNRHVICFTFGLFGLDVNFNAFSSRGIHRKGWCDDMDKVSQVIKSTSLWFSNHSIDEISEIFYREAEVGVAVQIITDMVETNKGTPEKNKH